MKVAPDSIAVATYHYVRPPTGPFGAVKGITPETFSRQLDILSQGRRILTPHEIRALAHGAELPAGSHIALTFDDGLRDHMDLVLPELEGRGLSAFFFVNTLPWEGVVLDPHKLHLLLATVRLGELRPALIEEADRVAGAIAAADPRALAIQYPYDDADVAAVKYALNFGLAPRERSLVLARLFERFVGSERVISRDLYLSAADCARLVIAGNAVGLHSHGHAPLSALAPDELAADLALNSTLLARASGETPWSIAYPYGTPRALSPAVFHAARRAGAEVGFTVEPSFLRASDDPLALPRIDTNDLPGGKRPRYLATEVSS